MKKIKLLLFVFIVNTSFLLAQNYEALPTRTIFSDDAFPVEKNYVEAEIGAAIEKNHWSLPFLIKYAPIKNLELGFSLTGVLNHDGNPINKTELGEPGVQFKWLNMRADKVFGTLVGGVSFPKNTKNSYLLYYVLSLDFSRVLINLHAGGYRTDDELGNAVNVATYAVSAIQKTNTNFCFFGELHGEKLPDEYTLMANFGINYAINEVGVLDLGLDLDLKNPSEVWILGFGITYGLGEL